MPLAFARHHPAGITENSPAFQRWVRAAHTTSPAGTAENRCLSRPFGTGHASATVPALKRWAILICPSGTGAEPSFSDSGHRSNPSGIGRDARPTSWRAAGETPAPLLGGSWAWVRAHTAFASSMLSPRRLTRHHEACPISGHFAPSSVLPAARGHRVVEPRACGNRTCSTE